MMTHSIVWAANLWLGSLMLAASHDSNDRLYEKPGSHRAASVLYEWRDELRSREVPVKIYYPQAHKPSSSPVGDVPAVSSEGFPVIIFSHGLGGSRDGYAYVGQHWASHGYVSVHVQHLGSDAAVLRDRRRPMETLRAAAADPQNVINRPLDIQFVLDRLEKLQKEEGPLKGRLDLTRVGVAGHSFGAYTTMAVAGQVFLTPTGRRVNMDDWRVKAAIAMSPNPPKRRDHLDEAYANIRIPILHLTGTKDDSPINDTKAADRRIAFDHIKSPDQYFVNFTDADHMVFAGRKRLRGGAGRDARFQELIRAGSTAFWDAYLKGDATAKAWLADGAFAKTMHGDGQLEVRLKR
jgi:predicted dienelactone hydrolase